MLIHKKIRQEITDILKAKLDVEAEFIAGRPAFLDLDEETTAVAVFIDEAVCEPISNCNSEWNAELNVVIYRKSLTNEAELDDISEKIIPILAEAYENDEFETVGDFELKGYAYEQDTQQRTWYMGFLKYNITYTN